MSMVQILIGDCDPDFVEFLIDVFRGAAWGHKGVECISCAFAGEFWRLASAKRWDVFVIGLNNLIFEDGPIHDEKAMKLAIEAKTTFGTPTFVLAPDSILKAHAAAVGEVDNHFAKPCDVEALLDAIGKSLS
jgi:hypothetical protein